MSTIVVLEVSHILYGNPLQLTARGARTPRPQGRGMQSPLLPRTRPARRAHPHSPGRPRRPGRMQSASTGSTATRHATPDSSLGRGVDKQGLDSPSTAGQRLRTEPVERRQTPGRLHRTRPLDESETAARAASRAARQPGLKRSAVTQRGGESNYLDSHTIPST